MVPENKPNRRYKQINFIGLQNNRNTSQHTVGNIHKASENCQKMPLYESIAEPLSHVLGLPPILQHFPFHDALQAYLFSIIHRTPLIWRLRTSFCFPA
jgi:hypothetical protein